MKSPYRPFGASTTAAITASGGRTSLADQLTDPLNQATEVSASDFSTPPAPIDEDEQETVAYILQWFEDARAARRPVEREMCLGTAMEEGKQWLGWDDAEHSAIDLMVDGEQDRYVTINLIGPMCLKLAALLTQTQPDCSTKPATDSPIDHAAADEGQAITAKCDRRFRRQLQTLYRLIGAMREGVAYTGIAWDPTAPVEIPIYGPAGQIAGKTTAPAGDVIEEFIAGHELLLDPNAREWDQVMAAGRESVRPLSWVQERFGGGMSRSGPGWLIDGDADTASLSFVDSFMQQTGGGSGFGSGSKEKTAVIVREWFHRSTPLYPTGRYVVVAGGRLMTPKGSGLPYRKPDAPGNWFPFVRTVWQEAAGHPYGRGLAMQLAQPQIMLNRMLTRALDHIDADVPTLLIAKGGAGSGLGPDAYEQNGEVEQLRGLRKIYFDNLEGEAPRWQNMLPLTPEVARLESQAWFYMQTIAGLHDASLGQIPSAATPGVVVELLQQGDKSQLGPVLAQVEQNMVDIGEWEIALYAQHVASDLPLMMGFDTSGDPKQAMMQAKAFRAITAGGSCSVEVVPGSAIPKSPVAENQQIMQWYQAGLFGPISDPQSAISAATMAIKLMSLTRSDEILLHLMALKVQLAQSQPDPAVIEAQRQAGVVQQQKLQAASAAQQQGAAAHAAAEGVAIATDAKMRLAEQAQQHQLQQLALQALHPVLTGKLDPVAVVELERRMGLEGEVPAPSPSSSTSTSSLGKFSPKFRSVGGNAG